MKSWQVTAQAFVGEELFEAARSTSAPAAFWWLGQHSFLLKLRGTSILVDPFLSPSPERLMEPLFAPYEASTVALVVCTHDHLDHIDPFAIAGLVRHSQAHFVAPRAVAGRMLSLGVPEERLSLMNDGETIAYEDFHLHAIKAAHERFDRTDDGQYPYLGYVFETRSASIYHAGDTVWWEGLQARLAEFRLDLALVPINGRDAERYLDDVVGNMVYQEAADLVGQLGVGAVFPSHHSMFAGNTEDPELFANYVRSRYPELKVLNAAPGQTVQLSGGTDG